MASSIELRWQKKKPTPTRSLPFIPRFGFYVDFAGYELSYKQVSIIEAFHNLVLKGMPPSQAKQMFKDQLAEVKFPLYSPGKVVETTFRTLSSKLRDQAAKS